VSVVARIFPPLGQDWKPERVVSDTVQEELLKRFLSRCRPLQHTTRRSFWRGFLRRVASAAEPLVALDDDGLRERLAVWLLDADSHCDAGLPELFALVAEFAARTLAMRPFDVQLIGARCLLDGRVVEMDTGEGKTLTASIAATVAALHGVDVHIITVNDYLTQRDADFTRALCAAVGLDVGAIVHGLTDEQRAAAYRCAVTYGTNKELAFDYLRDRIRGRGMPRGLARLARGLVDSGSATTLQVQRGLSFAIVDEADSVLIDEARSPLIISGQEENHLERDYLVQALDVARQLVDDRDFRVDQVEHEVTILDRGRVRIVEVSAELGPLWNARRRSEEMVRHALTALHLYHRDNHYIVDDDKIQIVDEHTGRVLEGRRWERGIHQLIELKEGVKASAQTSTIDRISYQDFFRRYLNLAGMTGTAREVARELYQIYDLTVIRVPTHRPARRRREPVWVLPDRETKFDVICAEVERLHGQGKPVLVGTRTVEDSELLSERLTGAAIQHSVLNAKNHSEEAAIIAEAGHAAKVTVATNMAGRGTDIKILPEVADLGGLHVIVTELHESRRIDRQLIGRCGRQGDPGTWRAIISLEDQLFSRRGNGLARFLRRLGVPLLLWYSRRLQNGNDARFMKIRRRLLRHERNTRKLLFFAGNRE